MLDVRFGADRLDAFALHVGARRRRDPAVTRRQFLTLTARAVGARVRAVDAGSPAYASFPVLDVPVPMTATAVRIPLGRRQFGGDFPNLRGGYGDLLAALASAVETLDTEVTAWRIRYGERSSGNS